MISNNLANSFSILPLPSPISQESTTFAALPSISQALVGSIFPTQTVNMLPNPQTGLGNIGTPGNVLKFTNHFPNSAQAMTTNGFGTLSQSTSIISPIMAPLSYTNIGQQKQMSIISSLPQSYIMNVSEPVAQRSGSSAAVSVRLGNIATFPDLTIPMNNSSLPINAEAFHFCAGNIALNHIGSSILQPLSGGHFSFLPPGVNIAVNQGLLGSSCSSIGQYPNFPPVIENQQSWIQGGLINGLSSVAAAQGNEVQTHNAMNYLPTLMSNFDMSTQSLNMVSSCNIIESSDYDLGSKSFGIHSDVHTVTLQNAVSEHTSVSFSFSLKSTSGIERAVDNNIHDMDHKLDNSVFCGNCDSLNNLQCLASTSNDSRIGSHISCNTSESYSQQCNLDSMCSYLPSDQLKSMSADNELSSSLYKTEADAAMSLEKDVSEHGKGVYVTPSFGVCSELNDTDGELTKYFLDPDITKGDETETRLFRNEICDVHGTDATDISESSITASKSLLDDEWKWNVAQKASNPHILGDEMEGLCLPQVSYNDATTSLKLALFEDKHDKLESGDIAADMDDVALCTNYTDTAIFEESSAICNHDTLSESQSHLSESQTSNATNSCSDAVKMEDDEDDDVILPDSTPCGSEDSIDSDEIRHSPSPMACLQLMRADTTSITGTYAASSMNQELNKEMHQENLLLSGHVPEDEECSGGFVWDDYLQETGATAAPHSAFKHVECSLQSGFVKGMRVEVTKKSRPGTSWVAAIIITCGPLLRLRYEGYQEDSSADFWCDLSSREVHPIGWSKMNSFILQPPDGVKEKCENWELMIQDALNTAPAAPSYLLEKMTGACPIDLLKQGMVLELQDSCMPIHVWLVSIMDSIGGRLLLRHVGMDDEKEDIWVFYLCELLHPVGWAREMGYRYVAPKVVREHGCSESDISSALDSALRIANESELPVNVFKDQERIQEHRFCCGLKLEAVHPRTKNHIAPATVIDILDAFYFRVEMDDLTADAERRVSFCCHSRTPTISAAQLTASNGIKLSVPPGWRKADFNWSDYLSDCGAIAAPESYFHLRPETHEFQRGHKLECVNPNDTSEICAATVTKLVAHMMWVHLDSRDSITPSHMEHVGSHNIYHAGWCEINGYHLQPPRSTTLGRCDGLERKVAVVQAEMLDSKAFSEQVDRDRSYCPKIYFNHKCFSGPHLSKGRIAKLPCSVGPGPLVLVMKEVLRMLISVAYKSSQVLREIQLCGPPNPLMNQQILKAKYNSRSYRAVVEICRTTAQLEEFCRNICIKLECCPNLISPHYIGDSCPEHCYNLTKTKFTNCSKKKRRIVRHAGGSLCNAAQNEANSQLVKRSKRQHLMSNATMDQPVLAQNEKDAIERCEGGSETSDGQQVADSSSGCRVKERLADKRIFSTSASAAASWMLKRKYRHHAAQPSDIRTRGAKLPRYSFERRTHKKVLLPGVPFAALSAQSELSQVAKNNSSTPTTCSELFKPSSTTQIDKLHVDYSDGNSSSCLSYPPSTSPIPALLHGLPLPSSPLPIDKSPVAWTVEETVHFIKTTDCAHIARLFREQEIDGQALLLLTLPTVQEHMDLKLGPAIKLCHEIERVKCAFLTRYDRQISSH